MYAYFDIGGTKTRVAVGDGSSFSEPVKFPTPKDFSLGVNTIVNTILECAKGERIEAIGGGIAGPLDDDHGMLLRAPNLPLWVGQPLARTLSERISAPTYLENDSAIVALGEAHHGAGQGSKIMAYITVSTGVGGARIVDGHVDRSTYGFEPGHQVLDIDKTVLPILAADEAEELLSGTALERRYNKKPVEIHDPAVWEELSVWLAYMLNNTIVHWSPDTVVLGGSMIVGDPAIPVDRVSYHLERILTIFPTLPQVRRAQLADLGGIYGAMAYVEQQQKLRNGSI